MDGELANSYGQNTHSCGRGECCFPALLIKQGSWVGVTRCLTVPGGYPSDGVKAHRGRPGGLQRVRCSPSTSPIGSQTTSPAAELTRAVLAGGVGVDHPPPTTALGPALPADWLGPPEAAGLGSRGDQQQWGGGVTGSAARASQPQRDDARCLSWG